MSSIAAMPIADAPSTTPLHDMISATASNVLTHFVSSADVVGRYTAAVTRYTSCMLSLSQAREALTKFEKGCTADTSGHVTLPRSLAFDLVKSAKLVAVEGDLAFYKDDISTIRTIERNATAEFQKALLAAKQKRITHLENRARQNVFMQTEIESHRAFVNLHAEAYNSSAGANSFPTESTVAHFAAHLISALPAAALNASMNTIELLEKAKAAHVANTAAQESIMAGAQTGTTIIALAKKVVDQRLAAAAHKRQFHGVEHHINKRARLNDSASSHSHPRSHSSSPSRHVQSEPTPARHHSDKHSPQQSHSVRIPFAHHSDTRPTESNRPAHDTRRNTPTAPRSDRPRRPTLTEDAALTHDHDIQSTTSHARSSKRANVGQHRSIESDTQFDGSKPSDRTPGAHQSHRPSSKNPSGGANGRRR